MTRAVTAQDLVIFLVDIPLLSLVGVVNGVIVAVAMIAALAIVIILTTTPLVWPVVVTTVVSAVVMAIIATIVAAIIDTVITAVIAVIVSRASTPITVVTVMVSVVVVVGTTSVEGTVVVVVLEEGLVDACLVLGDPEQLLHRLGLVAREILAEVGVARFPKPGDEDADSLQNTDVADGDPHLRKAPDIVSQRLSRGVMNLGKLILGARLLASRLVVVDERLSELWPAVDRTLTLA